MTAAKQIIYVDVNDEITTIIDKINGADARVIALVLPKRANMFQSTVNMKLLKRRVEQANKHLVLITSDSGLLPLAGLAGIYVAQTLQSKPEIPTAPPDSDVLEDIDEDEPVALTQESSHDFSASKNAKVPVGTLAAGGALGGLPDDMQELDGAYPPGAAKLGRQSAAEMAAVAARGSQGSSAGSSKATNALGGKKFSVPNFFMFRKRLVYVALGLVVLGGVYYLAWYTLPTAAVTITTKTTDFATSFDIMLDTNATVVNAKTPETPIIPAKIQQQQKNNTQQAPSTGSENKGNRATGTILVTNCSKDNKPVTIPAGTGVSANNLTYLTQNSVSLLTSAPDTNGRCRNLGSVTSASVNVVAQRPGTQYNLGASNFAVAGSESVEAKSDSAMSGGTDNNVKIVQQSDIDVAKQKMASAADQDTIKKQIQKTLEDNGLYVIQPTFYAVAGDLVTSAKVGDEAEAVTVTETTTYTMYGARKSDIRKLIETKVASKIDKSKQSIVNDGIDGARFTVASPSASPTIVVGMSVTAVAGPQLNVEQLKQAMAGKKSGVVKDEIKANPGVEEVVVEYSPFWVTKAPKSAKTTITFEKVSDAR